MLSVLVPCSSMSQKLTLALKFLAVCLICIGSITGIVFLIEWLT